MIKNMCSCCKERSVMFRAELEKHTPQRKQVYYLDLCPHCYLGDVRKWQKEGHVLCGASRLDEGDGSD